MTINHRPFTIDYTFGFMSRPTVKALSLLLLATALFYWKILFSREFTLLTGYEGVSQAYAWLQFWIVSIRHGTLPLWDPYSVAGHAFGGEMQTAAFYPLNLVLAAFPFNHDGVLSPRLYHVWFAFTHFLGACFMYALARELGLRRFAAIVAGICFSLGGFVSHGLWLDMLDSAIWLPLVFLFVLRALRAESRRRAVLEAALCGLSLGLAVLAGRLHMVMMQALVVASAVIFAGFQQRLRRKWGGLAAILVVAAVVSFCAGAVQLLVSMEYSQHVVRFFGAEPPLPATQRIPEWYPSHGLWPQGFIGGLLPAAFGARYGSGETIFFYLGVFPLLAAIIGVWKRWDNPWVRYLTGLAVVAFLYSIGEFSFFYGTSREVIPYLWMAREASRFMYLADFALAVLAAFGLEVLLGKPAAWRPLTGTLTAVVVLCAIAQAVPAVFGQPHMNYWLSFSLLMIVLSYGLFRYIIRGHTGTTARLLIVALILFDLASFNWTMVNQRIASRKNEDHLHRALSTRGAVEFLKSEPGRFRVDVTGNEPPPIGDLFHIPIINCGMRATLPKDYLELMGHTELLNPRYVMKPASATRPDPLYQDAAWKVYENPKALPPAWVVHEVVVEPSPDALVERLGSSEFNPRIEALMETPLDAALEPRFDSAPEEIEFGAFEQNRVRLTVWTQSRGLLVLSEIFYPGWQATVNGHAARIYKVDGGLRGVVVEAGENRVKLQYRPWSFIIGSTLSLIAFSGTLLAVLLSWLKSRRAAPKPAV